MTPHPAEAPVAWYVFADTEHWATLDENEAWSNRVSGFQVRPLIFQDSMRQDSLRHDPEVAALKEQVAEWKAWAKVVKDDIASNAAIAKIAKEQVVRVRALADEWSKRTRYGRTTPESTPLRARTNAVRQCMDELRAALEGSNV